MKMVYLALNRCKREKEDYLSKRGQTIMSFRKARTRTLIQLGGLVEKSGLLDTLGLKVGADLQRDETCLEGAAVLVGGFSEVHSMLQSSDSHAHKILWAERGKEILGQGST
jgi:hypothetical protein